MPFFLSGGTALGAGRGDEVYPLDDVARLGVVVIKPSFGVATADAYRWLDEDRAAGGARDGPARGRATSTSAGRPGRCRSATTSRRRSPAGIPASRRWSRPACAKGALGAAMTGSGSAVFGVFPEAAAAPGGAAARSGRTGSCS